MAETLGPVLPSLRCSMVVLLEMGSGRFRAGLTRPIWRIRITPISWTILNSLFNISNNARISTFAISRPSSPWPAPGISAAPRWSSRVSVSSLSQRLRDMEERLGVRLMNRTTRSVALTEAGELLLARVGPAMSDVGDALASGARPARRAVRPVADQCAAAGDRSGAGADGRAVPQGLSADRARNRRRQLVHRHRRRRFRCRRALRRASGAGHDRGLARSAAALRGGGLAAICCAAWPAETSKRSARSCQHPHPVRQRRDTGLGVREGRPCREGRAAGKADRELISGLALQAALDGVGFWPTFEGYVREDIESGALVSVLDDWCAPFPGPFLYYPSRRQPPPALGAFVAFVAEWRKQERRKGRGSSTA